MEKKFEKVNGTYATGMDYLRRTIEAYKALKESAKMMRPIDLARYMGKVEYHGGIEFVDYFSLVHPLHWLEEMGMVEKTTFEKEITLETYGPHHETRTKIIDGIEYTARVWVEKGEVKKVVKYNMWRAI